MKNKVIKLRQKVSSLHRTVANNVEALGALMRPYRQVFGALTNSDMPVFKILVSKNVP